MDVSDETKERIASLLGNGAFALFTLAAYTSFGLGAGLALAGVWLVLLTLGLHEKIE